MKPITGLMMIPTPEREFATNRASTPAAPPVPRIDYRSQMVIAYRRYLDKNYTLALATYRRVLADYPGDATALSGEAWSLYYLGDGDRAAVEFRALLHANAADSWARKGLALCEGSE
jgi:tetratricopeptide (TPR) repeat protein